MTSPQHLKSQPNSPYVVNKVPTGDSPYVKAKHVQLIDREPSKAISLFWSAINSGDVVDSALNDMAKLMKQLDRTDEAVAAIHSSRLLCIRDQNPLDNLLIDLYTHKLSILGRPDQGGKADVSINQERSRLLDDLACLYKEQKNYSMAEHLYREALSIEPDKNKYCNLAICFMNSGRISEAKYLLQAVRPSSKERDIADSYIKSYDLAWKMLTELEPGVPMTSPQQLKTQPTSPYVVNKVPTGDSPYVKAKHIQMTSRDPKKAICLFRSAIHAGDEVDSCLKEMVILMGGLGQSFEAVKAIKTFRYLCSPRSQEFLDMLIDFEKKIGGSRIIVDHVKLIQQKLKLLAKPDQEKKIDVTIEQERSRLLGELAWVYLHQDFYGMAEHYYREALLIEPDQNKEVNLAICLMNRGEISEAKSLLQAVTLSSKEQKRAGLCIKSYDRAWEMLIELPSKMGSSITRDPPPPSHLPNPPAQWCQKK